MSKMNEGQQNKNLYIGIDIHSEYHMAVAATQYAEEKGSMRFKNSDEGIDKFLDWIQQLNQTKEVILGIEGSGGNGERLTSTLIQKYNQIYEVNPLFTKQRRTYGTKRDKSDIRDARLITEILRTKLGELSRISREQQTDFILALKETVDWYEDLVYQRRRLKNQLNHLTKLEGLEKISFGRRNLTKTKQHYAIKNKSIKKQARSIVIRQKIIQLQSILNIEKQAKGEIINLVNKSCYQSLQTMPGIDTILTAEIIAGSEGIERFHNINQFIKYAGIAPVEKGSGKKTYFIQCKEGNRRLNTALYMATLNQLRWNRQARAYFDKKIKEGKTKKHALRCLMKRTACIVYGILKSKEKYRG